MTKRNMKIEINESRENKMDSELINNFIHGCCKGCGKSWYPVKSDKEGFNKLECPSCGCYKYESKEIFGDYEP